VRPPRLPARGRYDAEADIINRHSLESSGGRTYAELDRQDPVRVTMMNASFLRASLFTSVLAFGVSAMAVGLGVLIVLIGLAMRSTAAALGDRSEAPLAH